MRGLKSTKRYAVALVALGVWGIACQDSASSASGDEDKELSSASNDDENGTSGGDEAHTSEESGTDGSGDAAGDWSYECANSPETENDYAYPEPASGSECSTEKPCGDGSVCSDVWFPEAQGYTGAQCYPECRMEGASTPCCETGDVCVVLKEGTYACLARGAAKKESLKLKILPKGTTVNHSDVAYVGAKLTVDGRNIPLNMSYIIEEEADFDGDGRVEDVVIVELEGVAGIAGTWVFQITVPKDKWVEGELAAKRGEEGGSDFDAVLTKWVGQRMTVNAVLQEGTVTIVHPGAPCKAGVCDKAELGFDIDLIAIGASR